MADVKELKSSFDWTVLIPLFQSILMKVLEELFGKTGVKGDDLKKLSQPKFWEDMKNSAVDRIQGSASDQIMLIKQGMELSLMEVANRVKIHVDVSLSFGESVDDKK